MPLTTLSPGWIKPNEVRFRRQNNNLSGSGIVYVRYAYRNLSTNVVYYTSYYNVGSSYTSYASNISSNIVAGTPYRYEIYGYDGSYNYLGHAGGLVWWDTPDVQVQTATNITDSSATLRGYIDPGSYSPIYYRYRLQWGSSGSWYSSFYSRSSAANVSLGASSLTADTWYYHTMYIYETASAATELAFSNTHMFKTLQADEPPSVTTLSPDNITINSARLRATINSFGSYSGAYGDFQYRKGSSGDWTYVYGSYWSSLVTYFLNISGLDHGSYYQCRAVLDYTGGNVYGSTVGFWTLSVSPPSVSTYSCTGVGTTTATGQGEITSTGGQNAYRRGFCRIIGTSGTPTTADYTDYSEGSFGTGTFSQSLSGLSSNTNYRVRAYAINSSGGTGYGTTVQLTTLRVEPTVVTWVPDQVTATSARLWANVTSLGDYSGVYGDYEYREGTSGAWTYVYGSWQSTTGYYYMTVYGLTPDTYHQCRPVLYHAGGYTYGTITNFTTDVSVIHPIKYWTGASWQEVDRNKLKFRVGSSWVGDQTIKAYVAGAWKEI